MTIASPRSSSVRDVAALRLSSVLVRKRVGRMRGQHRSCGWAARITVAIVQRSFSGTRYDVLSFALASDLSESLWKPRGNDGVLRRYFRPVAYLQHAYF